MISRASTPFRFANDDLSTPMRDILTGPGAVEGVNSKATAALGDKQAAHRMHLGNKARQCGLAPVFIIGQAKQARAMGDHFAILIRRAIWRPRTAPRRRLTDGRGSWILVALGL